MQICFSEFREELLSNAYYKVRTKDLDGTFNENIKAQKSIPTYFLANDYEFKMVDRPF